MGNDERWIRGVVGGVLETLLRFCTAVLCTLYNGRHEILS